MLITFKSSAAADVMMYKMHAKPLLDLLEKNTDRGIITAAEMPAAIARIEQEVAFSKQTPAAPVGDGAQAHADDDEPESGKIVSFAARAFPLLEMMRAAQAEDTFVMWGV